MQDFTLAVQYLRQIAEQLSAMGADVPAWLQRSGLGEAQLSEPSFKLDFPSFCRLIEDGLATTGEAALGLLVGERLVVSSHGIVGFAALQSGSARQAIQLLERYFGVRTSLVAISLREEEQGIKFSLRSKGSINVQVVAASFGGGGHRNAAGGTLIMDMDQAKTTMVQAVTKELARS